MAVRLTIPPNDDVMHSEFEPQSVDRLMVSFTGQPEDPALSPRLATYIGLPAHASEYYGEVFPLGVGDEETHARERVIAALRLRSHERSHFRDSDRDTVAARQYRDMERAFATFHDSHDDSSNTRTNSSADRDELDDTQDAWTEGVNQARSRPVPQPPQPPQPSRLFHRSARLREPGSPFRSGREREHGSERLSNSRRLRFGHPHRSIRLVDGLGDRDRSLSPEGDGVWDTLQSTLTPDPQPPSVGSSFASTTVSTAASQNPTVPSSRTSITSPGEDVEPPCDPVNEPEGFVEGSEDVDAPHLDQPRRPRSRPSYAEAVSGTGSLTNEPEWLPSMHHIIRRLAARQDIPEEWWQQAGLTRSLSWGRASN
ncbi:hypothetical protein M434DRAFT_99757 [Hypoxylon sp. CO27-5]|nr:hypothetical protein M434DRAFT_99757 [Hypoxylon sp. CO27-5]